MLTIIDNRVKMILKGLFQINIADTGLILLISGGIPSKITLASFKPHYSFNFSEAQRVCELLDGVLATERQMQAEWNKGFQLCQ